MQCHTMQRHFIQILQTRVTLLFCTDTCKSCHLRLSHTAPQLQMLTSPPDGYTASPSRYATQSLAALPFLDDTAAMSEELQWLGKRGTGRGGCLPIQGRRLHCIRHDWG